MALYHGFTLFTEDCYETWELETVDNKALSKELMIANNTPLSKDPGVTDSEDCILDIEAPATKTLLEEVTSVLDTRGYYLTKTWGHVHAPNSSTLTHDHFDHVSWVYYAKTPVGCGRLKFIISQGWRAPRKIAVEPKEGMMLIFPHWVLHEVERNRSNEYRISISGNGKLKEQ